MNRQKLDDNGNVMPLLRIGASYDLTTGSYTCANEVVCIVAIQNSRIWYVKDGATKAGDGLLLPAGASIDIPCWTGYKIEIVGNVNLTKYI